MQNRIGDDEQNGATTSAIDRFVTRDCIHLTTTKEGLSAKQPAKQDCER
jgi:hypothetical protein